MDFFHQLSLIVPLFVALVLGLIVGIEREFVGKEAGTKTYSLVAMGSALFTVLSFDPNFPDPSRIIAQIVMGVGFIGAGLIIFHENKIHGLTTAAALWTMAAVGVAVGMRYYALSIATTFFVLVILYGVRRLRIEEKIHSFAGIKEEKNN